MQELLKKLRKYEMRMRKAINWQMQGDFHAIFKGSGLEFDDVRAYQYGDDVRIIDWKVTAKGHGTYVKVFKEEREQQVYFLVDVSASQRLGNLVLKEQIAKEIAGVLSISAVKEASQVGLIAFSDQRELYIKPAKGIAHAYEIITQLFNLNPASVQTNLSAAFKYCLKLIRKKSMIVVLSDFIDNNWEHNFKALAQRHDVVVLHIGDKRERNIPKLGLIPLLDKESNQTLWINSTTGLFRKKVAKEYKENKEHLMSLCKKANADYLYIDTAEDYIPQLISLFKQRNHRNKRAR